MFALQQELRKVLADFKSADYALSTWCKKARAHFDAGAKGDAAFTKWRTAEGDAPHTIKEYIARAVAAGYVPNAEAWDDVVGKNSGAISRLSKLTSKEVASTVSEAVAGKTTVRAVIQQKAKALAETTPGKSEKLTDAQKVEADLRQLAGWVDKEVKNLPGWVRSIVKRWS
jgi:hypothetical protein